MAQISKWSNVPNLVTSQNEIYTKESKSETVLKTAYSDQNF